MKMRMNRHSEQMSGSKLHLLMWLNAPSSIVFETETSSFQHHNGSAVTPAQIVPIRKESKIMKFLASL